MSFNVSDISHMTQGQWCNHVTLVPHKSRSCKLCHMRTLTFFLLSAKYIKTKSLLAIGHKRDTNPILRKESRATNQAAVFHWECEQADTSKHLRRLYDLVVRTYTVEQNTPGSITARSIRCTANPPSVSCLFQRFNLSPMKAKNAKQYINKANDDATLAWQCYYAANILRRKNIFPPSLNSQHWIFSPWPQHYLKRTIFWVFNRRLATPFYLFFLSKINFKKSKVT